MPLSAAAPRTLFHTRAITVQGYQREDGQFDIDAQIIDTKTYPFDTEDRVVEAGTPLHHMQARLTVDAELMITAAEAVTVQGPFTLCGGGADSFGRLAGLPIRAGFLRAANERLGGTIGCTHIRELLQQMATVAFQTTYPVRAARPHNGPPRLLNTCYAYAADGPLVARKWPDYFTGGAVEKG